MDNENKRRPLSSDELRHSLAPALHDSSVLLGSERVAGRLRQRLDLTGQIVAAGTGSQDDEDMNLNSSQGQHLNPSTPHVVKLDPVLI